MASDTPNKPRTLRRQIPLNPSDLPAEPDPARLPRLATRDQLAVIHARYFVLPGLAEPVVVSSPDLACAPA